MNTRVFSVLIVANATSTMAAVAASIHLKPKPNEPSKQENQGLIHSKMTKFVVDLQNEIIKAVEKLEGSQGKKMI